MGLFPQINPSYVDPFSAFNERFQETMATLATHPRADVPMFAGVLRDAAWNLRRTGKLSGATIRDSAGPYALLPIIRKLLQDALDRGISTEQVANVCDTWAATRA